MARLEPKAPHQELGVVEVICGSMFSGKSEELIRRLRRAQIAKQAVQMFGPAQEAVAKAVADSVEAGVIPQDQAENLCIVCGVFIHWDAEDNKKIYDYNYQATKDSIASAMSGKPSVDEMLSGKESAAHPYRGF